MWKKLFVALLSINLFIIVGATLWWGTLPKASSVRPPTQSTALSDKPATIQLAVGQDALNSYLEYALSEQQDVQRVMSYANIQFADTWTVQAGLKLSDRVVPVSIVLTPIVQSGNLILHVESATMGDIPVPTGALFFVMQHLPWPNWIAVDGLGHDIHLNLTSRPQKPYGIRVLSYSPTTKMVTVQVSIVPKAVLQSAKK